MDIFVWNAWFETGIEPVDQQHQKLVELINTLGDHIMQTPLELEEARHVLKALSDYACTHFSDEEQLMGHYGLDKRHTDKQRKEHREFVQHIASLTDANSQAEYEILHRYLVSWLSFHILGTDLSMARQVKLIRSGIDPAVALSQELATQDRGSAALQDAMHNLYDLVAEQNRLLQASNNQLAAEVAKRTQALEAINADLRKDQQALSELNQQLEQAQNQALQSEKMAAIGQLAAGVAHEINNPIGYVNSNLGTLKTYVERLLDVLSAYAEIEKLVPTGQELTTLRSIKEAAELDYLKQDVVDLLKESRDGLGRVTKIVQDLKDFSHVDDAEWIEADLNHGLDSTLNVVWNEVKYKAKVIKDYSDLPPFKCVASQINQVFMNLIVNASHAIEESGTITLRTRFENGQIMIEVADTGKGIPLDIQRRIFEPFFTTKPVGKGTGLGLSLSYDIVKKHGGHFDVSSEPGVGTSFKVWLPLAQEDATT